jgi:hypothetical protein
VFGAGLVCSALPGPLLPVGVRIGGAGLLALAVWGWRYDVARRTIKVQGLSRYMAVCLLSGYVWLLAGGIAWLAIGDLGGSIAGYDLALHALFLGFVMSMIFGHAPVILPAVLGVRLPFRPWFYVHLGVLHLALLVRLVGGDLIGNRIAWQAGGIGTEVAVVLFLVVSATTVMRSRSTVARRVPTSSGSVSRGPAGGSVSRGPAGGSVSRGPAGGSAARGPTRGRLR